MPISPKLIEITKEASKLHHNGIIPLYYQLKEIILEKIESEEWHEGDLIPSESDLMQVFSISRATVRRTLDLLTNEGFLEKKRGKGTFVRRLRIEEKLLKLKSFTEEMIGRDAYKKVITAKYIESPLKIRKVLHLLPEEKVLLLKRLMIVDEIALGILIEYIPSRYNLSLEEDYSKSLYNIFEKYDIRLKDADQIIEASMSTKEEIALMGLKKAFPTLLIKRIVYSKKDEPIEYVKGVYHADRYRYMLKLIRDL